ncbi:MAG: arginine repressor [Candidatus Fimimonas sp.]
MSRSARQAKILEIISRHQIETQEELADALKNEGFEVTQATVSRDIKELGLLKTQNSAGRYNYVTQRRVETVLSPKMLNVLRETIVSVVTAENLVVVKTIADSATAVSGALEQLSLQKALGMLADRSTVLIVSATHADAEKIAQKIKELTQ